MLLLAAAQASGLLTVLPQIIPSNTPAMSERLAQSQTNSRQQLLQTLLFMPAVNVYRSYDLRSYSGDALGLLSERSRPFGYAHTERFLSQLARAGAAETATDALAAWTTQLWQHNEETVYYVDGHHKPVYSDVRIPRGLIGRTGKILGSRALTLLNDEHGHPLLVMTGRGDQHLTVGLPEIVRRYDQHRKTTTNQPIVVDRECMSASFLKEWSEDYTLVTILRSNQYKGIVSFDEVGEFVPFATNSVGDVIKDVASARFNLSVPEHDQPLALYVALLRDHQQAVASALSTQVYQSHQEQPWANWTEPDWQAQPTPETPTEPKLIPIVSTGAIINPCDLVELYQRRWAAQENIIKDFLLPLGLDINHGYAKQLVENSEFRKKYDALSQRLERLDRWRKGALQRSDRASRRYNRLFQALRTFSEEQYRLLNANLMELEQQNVDYYQRKAQIKAQKDAIDSQIDQQQAAVYHANHQSGNEFQKAKRYAQKQCELKRELIDLEEQVRDMFQLDDRKDQLMSVFKVTLTNLVMWTRDCFFPPSYAQATWKRLQPFFRLPGRIVKTDTHCAVYLRPFNDLALNRDLLQLCQKVNLAHLTLPDGRILQFYMDRLL